MSNGKTLDLLHGSVPKALLKFTWPILLANLMQTLYSMVDMAIVGHLVGSVGLSAISNSSQVTMLFTTIGIGLVMGGQMMIAQFKGAGEHEALQETIGTSLTFMLILAVVFTVPSILCINPILRMLNLPEECMSDAYSYLFICLAGTVFIYGYNGVCTILRGLGDSTRPMIFVAISSVTNIILDLIFVGPLGMGTAGAAIATIISQALSFFIAAVYLYRNRDQIDFDFKPHHFKVVGKRLKGILKIGIPFAVQFSAITISVMFIMSLVNSYGVAASAAYGACSKVDNFCTMPMFSLGTAASTVIGQNIGARQQDRARSVVHWGIAMGLGCAVVIVGIVQLIPGTLVSIFNTDPEVIEIGTLYLHIVSISYFGHALLGCYEAMANGIGFTLLTLICSLFDSVCLRISLAYLFAIGLGMGITGVFLGAMIAPFGAALVSGIYFYSGKWRTREILH